MSLTSITHSLSGRIASGAVGVAMAITLLGVSAPVSAAALSQAQVDAIVSLLQSFGADATTIANVKASLTGGTPIPGGGSTGACPALSRDLKLGSSGTDVKALQVFLNSSASTQVAASGAGSPGNESTYFGSLTQSAAVKFQAANNVSPAAGYVGPITRAAIAAVCGKVTPGPNPTPTPTGPGITVSAASQPANSLAVASAARVPFTTFTLTNNSSAAVTVNSVTVQRTGLGVDANFSGVVLLDSNGIQIGNAKTFNSNHQANVGDTGFTLGAGASMTFTVAGNMANSSTVAAGQVVSLQVVAVNTSAPVSGSLPIVGASHTINATLTIGSFSTSTSSVIPKTGSTVSRNVGDTGVRFAGLKFTANSAEDLKLYSIRWRQIGSASSVDLANVTTVAGGTTYPTTVDSTGKYYTAVFPGGILITKGNSIDLYVQGDLVGSNSAGRTVQFSIDRSTDVYFVGQLYGYGIGDTSAFSTSQPWYTGDSFSVNAGSASTISKSNAAADAAQNIAVNVQNQPLGGFTTNFLGEPVTISGLTISVASSSSSGGPLTSVSITDNNGAVVSGPVDENSSGNLVFSDSITFPTGLQTYHVKGRVSSGTNNGATITLTVTPSNWSNPTGQTTGSSITISNAAFALNQMTVRGATTTIAVSSSPIGQNVVAGTQGYVFTNIQVDASQSGEDIRISSLPVLYTSSGTSPNDDLSSCQLYDGTTALTTGSRVINSTGSSGSTLTFSFDNPLVVPKGTVKTISVVCNISGSATNGATYQFGINASGYSATGVTSGVSITPSIAAAANGGAMVVASGSATVAVDSSQPSFKLVAAGTAGVTNTVLRFRANNEALTLQKIGLTLVNSVGNTKSSGSGGSTNGGASDVVMAYIYQGSTLVGTANFTGSNTTATSTLNPTGSTPVVLNKDVDTLLTIKVDLAPIGVSAAGGIGDIIRIDPLNFEATGASSGSTVQGPSTTNTVTTGTTGMQMFKTFPTVANAGISCNQTTNCVGTAVNLKKFSITASAANNVGLNTVTVSLATSSAKVSNLKLYAYTDSSYSTPANVSGTTAGQFGGTAPLFGTNGETAAPTLQFFQTTPLQIPAGTTYYFALVGDVALNSGATTWTVNATVKGDSATSTSLATYNANVVGNLDGTRTAYVTGVSTSTDNTSNFIWSGNSTTTATVDDVDWANGYFVPGLPSSGF